MTESDIAQLEIAKTAVIKAAQKWREDCDSDKRVIALIHAVDHYEDVLYAIEESNADGNVSTAANPHVG